jgi:hypothetical protein
MFWICSRGNINWKLIVSDGQITSVVLEEKGTVLCD